MSEPYRIVDLGERRVLTVDGREYPTRYSERVIRMLIERKGARRAPLYFDFKETRGGRFLGPLFGYLRGRGARDLAVLEAGCSFGHITEHLAEQPEVATLHAFDTDSAFVALTRAKVEELGLARVHEVAHFTNDETRRLPWADGAFDLVLAVGVVEHLPLRSRRAQVDEYYRVLAPGGHIAILDTPNRWFPLETHSVGPPRFVPCPTRSSSPMGPAGGTQGSPTASRPRAGGASRTSARRPATAGASSATPRGRAPGARCCRSFPRRAWPCASGDCRRRSACPT